ncbi:MAG: hypothetical protein M3Z02_08145, partial [Actinomycetota bacterium]|nr:hypothetical protein [Actinomycetota bacterium]
LVRRFHRARGTERAQVKWFAFGGLATIVEIAGATALDLRGGLDALSQLVIVSTLPAAIGVAILRYRLYDIDRIVSRTVGYALVTGLLVVVYVSSVTVVTRLTPSGNSLAVAASTLAVAALFQPVRRRVQAGVDRRFNRSRYDAARTIDAFSARLREQVDLDTLASDLISVVRRTMQPASAGVWLRPVEGATR